MGTVFLRALEESFRRRLGLWLLLLAVLVPGFYFWLVSFQTQADGTVMAQVLDRFRRPASFFVPATFAVLLRMTATAFFYLAVFATAPLLTSFMEKGWADLLLSKGVPRWQVLLGRYASAVTLFLGVVLVADVTLALYFWGRTGIAPGNFLGALGLLALSFACLAALMTLGAMVQASPVLIIGVAVVQMAVSTVLAQREGLYTFITTEWVHWLMDGAYYVLPKNSELHELAFDFLQSGAMSSWGPVWSSVLPLLGALGVAAWLLHRKSF